MSEIAGRRIRVAPMMRHGRFPIDSQSVVFISTGEIHTSEKIMDPTPIVLVIDDNIGDIDLIKEAISDCSLTIEVHQAFNGVQAFEYLTKLKNNEIARKPAFILLDLNMPIFHGVHVLTFIKKTEQLKNIPVTVFTSSSKNDDKHICLALGADNYVPKPPELSAFRLAIMNLKRKYIGCCHEIDCRLV